VRIQTRLSPFAVLIAATTALANNGDVVVTTTKLEGDAITGIGNLARLDNLEVNNAGTVWSEWDTDIADTTADSIVLRDDAVVFQEGQSTSMPAGFTLGSFDSIRANNNGDVVYNLFFDPFTVGVDSGLFFNETLVMQEGDPVAALSPGTVQLGFFDVRINDANQVLVMGTVDDPNIPSAVDQALIRYDLDAAGTILGSTVIAVEGDLTSFGATITTIENSSQELALNDSGSVIWAGDTDAPSSVDGFIAIDSLVIAIEGSASPIEGRNWQLLSSPEVDLNNNGDHVHSGQLTGDSASSRLLVKNGEKFRQTGDEPPGFPGFSLTSFGTGPLLINDRGEVLWYGDWDDPNTSIDSGLFLDDTLLLREGDAVGGLTIDSIRGVTDGYAMSDDGSAIVVEVLFEGNLDGLVRITRQGSVTTISGCIPSASTLTLTSANPVIGGTSTFAMDASPYATALASIYYSIEQLDTGIGCGLNLPGIGELLLAPGVTGSVPLPPFAGAPTTVDVTWPDSSALIGVELFFQGLFVDATLSAPNPARLTNALGVTFGV
jgi:hypothetical protein